MTDAGDVSDRLWPQYPDAQRHPQPSPPDLSILENLKGYGPSLTILNPTIDRAIAANVRPGNSYY